MVRVRAIVSIRVSDKDRFIVRVRVSVSVRFGIVLGLA